MRWGSLTYARRDRDSTLDGRLVELKGFDSCQATHKTIVESLTESLVKEDGPLEIRKSFDGVLTSRPVNLCRSKGMCRKFTSHRWRDALLSYFPLQLLQFLARFCQ